MTDSEGLQKNLGRTVGALLDIVLTHLSIVASVPFFSLNCRI
jgi:hypothetical protein